MSRSRSDSDMPEVDSCVVVSPVHTILWHVKNPEHGFTTSRREVELDLVGSWAKRSGESQPCLCRQKVNMIG
jgi:hypothetical protein